MGGGGDDVGVGKGAGEDLGSDEAGDVSHVGQQVGVGLVADLAHALIVDKTAVGTGAGNNDLGAVDERKLLELVVVDQTGRLIQSVWERLEVLGNEGYFLGWRLVAVGQVAAVRKVKTHQAIMGVHERRVDVQIGGSARKSWMKQLLAHMCGPCSKAASAMPYLER